MNWKFDNALNLELRLSIFTYELFNLSLIEAVWLVKRPSFNIKMVNVFIHSLMSGNNRNIEHEWFG